MYGPQGKLTVRMGDGLTHMLRANAFCTYMACNRENPQVRHLGQYKFLSEALDDGFKWAVEELKQNKNGIHPNIQNDIQLSPSRVPSEYHLTFKSTKLHKNHNLHTTIASTALLDKDFRHKKKHLRMRLPRKVVKQDEQQDSSLD
eukprot:5613256-Ditylum_brightwellii.AAC.1